MNCQDNSRLKVPLPEMCKTTDIGCVPMTSGKPNCPPERDQIPLAYDVDSQTLWIFSCDSRQWVAMSKFQLAELQEVSLDNIRNICELLKIPVYYNPGGGTVQGSMPLVDFGKELLKCQDMTPKAAVLPSGLTSFTIEGLESLDPLYVKYVNLEVSGTGSETNPLVVKAQDPLVKWPKKTEEDVDNADQPMLAADLDGEMVRVPYPKKPCEFPKIGQSAVDAAEDLSLIACADGQNVKIPYPQKPCEYERLTQSQVEGANEALIIGCVDESNVKIPYPPQPKDYDPATQDQVDGSNNRWLVAVIDGKQVKIPFPKGVCEFTRKTGEEISAATTDIIACVGGEASQIPLSTLKDNINSGDKWICDLPCATPEELESSEGFSIAVCIGGVMRQMFIDCGSGSGGKFPSIPVVCGMPVGPPAEGTPPLRVDCDGYLWVWDENTSIWVKVGGSDAPNNDVAKYSSISGDINNKCADTLIRGYYLDKNDLTGGYKHTKLSPSDLVGILDACGLASDAELNNRYTELLRSIEQLEEYFAEIYSNRSYPLKYWENPSSRGITFSDVNLDSNGFACFSVHGQFWENGSGTIVQSYEPGGGPATPVTRGGKVQITNPFDKDALAVCHLSVTLASPVMASRISQSLHMMMTDDPNLSDSVVRQGQRIIEGVPYYSNGAPTDKSAICIAKPVENSPVNYYFNGPVSNPTSQHLSTSCQGQTGRPYIYRLSPNETKDLYLRGWCSMYAPTDIYVPGIGPSPRPTTISVAYFGFIFMMNVSFFPA